MQDRPRRNAATPGIGSRIVVGNLVPFVWITMAFQIAFKNGSFVGNLLDLQTSVFFALAVGWIATSAYLIGKALWDRSNNTNHYKKLAGLTIFLALCSSALFIAMLADGALLQNQAFFITSGVCVFLNMLAWALPYLCPNLFLRSAPAPVELVQMGQEDRPDDQPQHDGNRRYSQSYQLLPDPDQATPNVEYPAERRYGLSDSTPSQAPNSIHATIMTRTPE